MGAVIIFSQDNTAEKIEYKFKSTYVNSRCWDAFGDLLDAVFLPGYPKLHDMVKSEEGEYLKFYSFAELNKQDFNLAVRLIREYIPEQIIPTEWHRIAQIVWKELTKPYIVQDDRYEPR